MPTSVRRAILAILVLAAVSGWTATVILISSVYTPASAPDQALARNANSFVADYVKAEAGTGAYEQAEHWLTGQALSAVKAEQAAGAAPVEGLAIADSRVDAIVLWRAGDQALAEVTFTLTAADGSSTQIGEHMLLVFHDSDWKIDTIWRITLDPSTQLLPSPPPDTGSPAPTS